MKLTLSEKLEKLKTDEKKNKYLYNIPPKKGRYIVLDTETTGLHRKAHLIELGAHEIINGKLTGTQFHIYIKPRESMSKEVINIHKISNDYYDKYCENVYESDKNNMENFLKFIGNSIIFAHNSPFDMNIINNELSYWKLQTISQKRFRCTMRIFYNVISKIDLKYSLSFSNLGKCCEYFNIKSDKNNFHNALFDSYMTARVICHIYELLDKNKELRNNKQINYTTNSIDSLFQLNKDNSIISELKKKRVYKEINNKDNNIIVNKEKIKILSDNKKSNIKIKIERSSSQKENVNQLSNEKINKTLNNNEEIVLTQEDLNILFSKFFK